MRIFVALLALVVVSGCVNQSPGPYPVDSGNATGMPDLYTDNNAIFFSIPSPKEYTNMVLTARVDNAGNETAGGVLVRFYASGKLVGDSEPADIQVGAYHDFTVKWIAFRGNVTIRAVVDPDNKIAEIDEGDNIGEKSILVLTQPGISGGGGGGGY